MTICEWRNRCRNVNKPFCDVFESKNGRKCEHFEELDKSILDYRKD